MKGGGHCNYREAFLFQKGAVSSGWWQFVELIVFLVAKSCPTLCDPMDCSTPGLPVYHYLLELAQTHSHWNNDATNHLIPYHPLLLPSIFPSIRVFSNEWALGIRWPKYWSFSISPFNEYTGLISFRDYWFGLLAVQGPLIKWREESHWRRDFPGGPKVKTPCFQYRGQKFNL